MLLKNHKLHLLVYVFSIKDRKSDILLKIINFIYSVDKTLRVIKILDFNRTGPICYNTLFLTPVPTKNAAFSYIVLSRLPNGQMLNHWLREKKQFECLEISRS